MELGTARGVWHHGGSENSEEGDTTEATDRIVGMKTVGVMIETVIAVESVWLSCIFI